MKRLSSPLTYHALFSYRMLRFVSLLCMSAGAIGGVFYSVGKLIEKMECANPYAGYMAFLHFSVLLGQISLPLLLISAFTEILREKKRIWPILLKFFLMSILLYYFYAEIFPALVEAILLEVVDNLPAMLPGIMEILTNQNFLTRITPLIPETCQSYMPLVRESVNSLTPEMITQYSDPSIVKPMIDEYLMSYPDLIPNLAQKLAPMLMMRLANTNFFLDIFLCTLIYQFTCVTPKKLRGGKVLFYRLFAALPIGYIAASLFLGAAVRKGWVILPTSTLAALACSHPYVFVIFGAILFFIKYEEIECKELNYSKEEMMTFRKSDTEAVRFSVFISIVLAGICVFELFFSQFSGLKAWGLGTGTFLFMGIPFVMLFSFTKIPKHKWIDLYVPIYLSANAFAMFFLSLVAIGDLMKVLTR